MEEKKLDSLIRDILYQKTRNVSVPCGLRDKILEEIDKKDKEVWFMRKFGWKKMVVIAAALCMMGSIVAIGAGKVTGLVSSSSSTDNQFPTFEDAKKAGDELGFPVQFAENFSSGYQYEKGNIIVVEGLDDDNNKVGSYKNLWLNYKGPEGDTLNLTINKSMEVDSGVGVAAKAEQDVNGLSVSYYCDRYKMFPPNTQIPQEDLDAQERGELYISVGGSEIEEMYSCHASWTKDGVHYSLMNIKKQMSADEMFAMAKEVMESEVY